MRIPDETLNYWGDQFVAHGLWPLLTFEVFMEMSEGRRRRFLQLSARRS